MAPPKTWLFDSAGTRPTTPVHEDRQCGLCTFEPDYRRGGGWLLKFIHGRCRRHMALIATQAVGARNRIDHNGTAPVNGRRLSWLPAVGGLVRCPVPSCPMRDAPGRHRPCPLHGDQFTDDGAWQRGGEAEGIAHER